MVRSQPPNKDDVVEVVYETEDAKNPTLTFRVTATTDDKITGTSPGGDRIRLYPADGVVTRNGTQIGYVVDYSVVDHYDRDDDSIVTDGGVDVGDVPRCDDCKRYAAHTFDHAVSCPSHQPIGDDTDLRHRTHEALVDRLASLEAARTRYVTEGDERHYRRATAREEAVRAELVRRAATRERGY